MSSERKEVLAPSDGVVIKLQGTSSDTTNEEKEEYNAEKILDKPTISGETQCFIKQEGYSADENTGEVKEDHDCKELIEVNVEEDKFKTEENEDEDDKNTKWYETHNATSNQIINILPEEIINAVNLDGDLWFLIKWKGTDQAGYILAEEFELSHPQMVFSFYEKRLHGIDSAN